MLGAVPHAEGDRSREVGRDLPSKPKARFEMTEDIAGKVAIITGASSGLGEATARHLAAQGAHVTLGARRKDRLEALASEIRNGGGKAEMFVTDVSRREDVEALDKGTVGAFGRVDVLVNNAGIMLLSLLDKRKVDEWDRMIRLCRSARSWRCRSSRC